MIRPLYYVKLDSDDNVINIKLLQLLAQKCLIDDSDERLFQDALKSVDTSDTIMYVDDNDDIQYATPDDKVYNVLLTHGSKIELAKFKYVVGTTVTVYEDDTYNNIVLSGEVCKCGVDVNNNPVYYILDAPNNPYSEKMLRHYQCIEYNAPFHAFEHVLVRDSVYCSWKIELFSHYVPNVDNPYVCMNAAYRNCIPHSGNDILIGTRLHPIYVNKYKPI